MLFQSQLYVRHARFRERKGVWCAQTHRTAGVRLVRPFYECIARPQHAVGTTKRLFSFERPCCVSFGCDVMFSSQWYEGLKINDCRPKQEFVHAPNDSTLLVCAMSFSEAMTPTPPGFSPNTTRDRLAGQPSLSNVARKNSHNHRNLLTGWIKVKRGWIGP